MQIAPEQTDFESLMFGKDRQALCVTEVAAKLRVTDQHVLDLIAEGQIGAVNVGGATRRHFRIPVEEYMKFLRSRDSRRAG